MIVGLRVVKTVISIGISIAVARWLHLEPAHFAGIVSMLAVQPSVYRSLRHSLSHMASALLASVAGIVAAHIFGSGVLVFVIVTLLVMAVHVRLNRTTSLTVAVIVAINTIGTSDKLSGGTAAYYQLLLVWIGMTVGTVVNAIIKPVHREREEVLLAKSEGMLRALLYYIQLDLQAGRMTPYKPDMRTQIEEVRTYIEKGKRISKLIREDLWLSRSKDPGAGELFLVYETMVERIRDLVKALQKADLTGPERLRLIRAIGIVAGGQERLMKSGKRIPLAACLGRIATSSIPSGTGSDEMDRLFPYYKAYEALADYIRELEASRSLTANRPGHQAAAVSRRQLLLRQLQQSILPKRPL
ncbi:FUSC family protein [Gordoniibacillus kamchatkensis]|uniref:FUSC family protein n=1 Tax=Gordoniibacillus kamchatkensis TaxID=1590651 RepID=UPI0009E64B96|nr:aromatic acid exporter family protein [Paenibacillus sp. VKM B-2647]